MKPASKLTASDIENIRESAYQSGLKDKGAYAREQQAELLKQLKEKIQDKAFNIIAGIVSHNGSMLLPHEVDEEFEQVFREELTKLKR